MVKYYLICVMLAAKTLQTLLRYNLVAIHHPKHFLSILPKLFIHLRIVLLFLYCILCIYAVCVYLKSSSRAQCEWMADIYIYMQMNADSLRSTEPICSCELFSSSKLKSLAHAFCFRERGTSIWLLFGGSLHS